MLPLLTIDIPCRPASSCRTHQHGVSSELFAVTVLPDGSPVVAGAEWSDSEGWDFLAIKLDPPNEAVTWEWKVGDKLPS